MISGLIVLAFLTKIVLKQTFIELQFWNYKNSSHFTMLSYSYNTLVKLFGRKHVEQSWPDAQSSVDNERLRGFSELSELPGYSSANSRHSASGSHNLRRLARRRKYASIG